MFANIVMVTPVYYRGNTMRFITGTALAVIAALALSSSALAQAAPPSACKALSGEVVKLRKELSSQRYGSLARSAPQATQLATEMANTLAMMKMNLDLMTAHRCAMPTEPIRTSTYMLGALECSIASPADSKEKCDESKWTMMGEKASQPTPAAP